MTDATETPLGKTDEIRAFLRRSGVLIDRKHFGPRETIVRAFTKLGYRVRRWEMERHAPVASIIMKREPGQCREPYWTFHGRVQGVLRFAGLRSRKGDFSLVMDRDRVEVAFCYPRELAREFSARRGSSTVPIFVW